MPGADGNALAARSTAAAQHRSTGIGLHARPKPVCFHTVAAVGLKGTLGHVNRLLFAKENLRVTPFPSIPEAAPRIQRRGCITMRHCSRNVSRILGRLKCGEAERAVFLRGDGVALVTETRSFTILGATYRVAKKLM